MNKTIVSAFVLCLAFFLKLTLDVELTETEQEQLVTAFIAILTGVLGVAGVGKQIKKKKEEKEKK